MPPVQRNLIYWIRKIFHLLLPASPFHSRKSFTAILVKVCQLGCITCLALPDILITFRLSQSYVSQSGLQDSMRSVRFTNFSGGKYHQKESFVLQDIVVFEIIMTYEMVHIHPYIFMDIHIKLHTQVYIYTENQHLHTHTLKALGQILI